MNGPTITCKYSCSLCGIQRQSVVVQARAEEDVLQWMEDVATPALVADHSKRSPNCHPSKFSEVMIPMTGADKVGGPVVN